MTALTLSPAERRAHRAAAHHLHPLVRIGSDGLTPAVVHETDVALRAHGLVKVRAFVEDRELREAMLAQLCNQVGAAPVQHVGKLLVLWRPVPPKDKGKLEDRKPGPRIVKLVTFSRSGNHRAMVKKVKLLGNQRVTAGGQVKRSKARQTSAKKRQAAA